MIKPEPDGLGFFFFIFAMFLPQTLYIYIYNDGEKEKNMCDYSNKSVELEVPFKLETEPKESSKTKHIEVYFKGWKDLKNKKYLLVPINYGSIEKYPNEAIEIIMNFIQKNLDKSPDKTISKLEKVRKSIQNDKNEKTKIREILKTEIGKKSSLSKDYIDCLLSLLEKIIEILIKLYEQTKKQKNTKVR